MEIESDPAVSHGEFNTVCSLCGDIGFKNSLILCRKCGFRHQHTYCSRFYPDIEMEYWSCEWCIHEEEKQASKRRKLFEFLLEIAQSLPEKNPAENAEKRIPRKEDRYSLPEEKVLVARNQELRSETKEEKAAGKKSVRCAEKNKALDRWRSLAKNRLGGCRRYKLLADVLC